MVAFVGKQHVRNFEREYNTVHADLWAFGHRKRKMSRVRFGIDPFETFQTLGYEHMLLIHELHHIPMFFDAETVIEYKLSNKTVASLWPKRVELPASMSALKQFLRLNGGITDVVHL